MGVSVLQIEINYLEVNQVFSTIILFCEMNIFTQQSSILMPCLDILYELMCWNNGILFPFELEY